MALNANELDTLMSLIGRTDNAQLNTVIERVKLQRTWLTRQVAREVTVNDNVEFEARGTVIRGVVTKVNRKTIMVRQTNATGGFATNWKVSAGLLRKVA
jgi:hypothetical protein